MDQIDERSVVIKKLRTHRNLHAALNAATVLFLIMVLPPYAIGPNALGYYGLAGKGRAEHLIRPGTLYVLTAVVVVFGISNLSAYIIYAIRTRRLERELKDTGETN